MVHTCSFNTQKERGPGSPTSSSSIWGLTKPAWAKWVFFFLFVLIWFFYTNSWILRKISLLLHSIFLKKKYLSAHYDTDKTLRGSTGFITALSSSASYSYQDVPYHPRVSSSACLSASLSLPSLYHILVHYSDTCCGWPMSVFIMPALQGSRQISPGCIFNS